MDRYCKVIFGHKYSTLQFSEYKSLVFPFAGRMACVHKSSAVAIEFSATAHRMASYADESMPNSPYTKFFATISSYTSRLLFGIDNSGDEQAEEEESDDWTEQAPQNRPEDDDSHNYFAESNENYEQKEITYNTTQSHGYKVEEMSTQGPSTQKATRQTELTGTEPETALERLNNLERKIEQLETFYTVTERRLQRLEKNVEDSSSKPRHRFNLSKGEGGMWSDKIWKGMTVWRPFSSKRTSIIGESRRSLRSRLLEDMKRVRSHIPLLHSSSDEPQDSSSSENSSELFRTSSSLSSSLVDRANTPDSPRRDRQGTRIDESLSKTRTSNTKEVELHDYSNAKSISMAQDNYHPSVNWKENKRKPQGDSPRKVPADKQSEKIQFQSISEDPAYYDSNSLQYGNYLLWSGKLVDAAKFFQKRIENKCNSSYKGWLGLSHPRDLLLYAESYMLRVWFTGSIQQALEASELFEQALEAASNGQRVLERMLDKNVPSNERERQLALYDWEDCRLVIADGNLFKSIMLGLAGHTIKAGIALRKGWKAYALELDNVIQEFEHFQTCHVYTDRWEDMTNVEEFSGIAPLRAIERELCLGEAPIREYIGLTEAWMFGLGFYLLLVSLAPPGYYKVLQVLGFQANRPLGLALLEAAFSRALIKESAIIEGKPVNVPLPLSAPVAAHAIAWDLLEFYAFSSSEYELSEDKRLSRANMVCRRCLELFPDSPIWLWLAGVHKRKLGNLDESVKQLHESVENFGRVEKANVPVRLLEYLRYVYLTLGNFEQIEQISFKLIQRSNDSIPIGSYLCLGIVEMSRENWTKADAMFQKANTFVASRSLTDFEEFCQWKAGVFMQRQYARVVSAEVICCSLMYHSLNKDYIQPWIDWLLQDKNCLEKQLEQHLGKNKKSVSSDETSPRLTNLFSSWKGLSRTNVTNAVRGDERSVISELSVCYYALGTFYRLLNDLATAEDYLIKVCENTGDEDAWLGMCSRFEISLVYREKGNISLASDYLRRSLNVSRNITCGGRAVVSEIQRCKRRMQL